MTDTLLVNLFAGPSAGKSSTAYTLCGLLKWDGVNAELAPEFAKDLTWEERRVALEDQIYIFGKQHFRVKRLIGKVDVIVTDSPLPLSLVYLNDDREAYQYFSKMVLSLFKEFNSINYFIERDKPYMTAGRTQSEEEAIVKDRQIKDLLIDNDIKCRVVKGNKVGVEQIHGDILDILDNQL
jgi:hypothetical protein